MSRDNKFDFLFSSTLKELAPIINTIDMAVFSRHNRGYDRYKANDLINGLISEKERYRKTFDFVVAIYNRKNYVRLLDVGSLTAILPIMFSKIGIGEVNIIDNFSFYGDSLDRLRILLEHNHKIKVHDMDILRGLSFGVADKFDIVMLLSTIEHFILSPIRLLREIRDVLDIDGMLILDTPNVASLLKRILFSVKGIPPYPPIEDFLFSEFPFTGHNREYSLKELQKVLDNAGFEVLDVKLFNLAENFNLKVKLIQYTLPVLFSGLRDHIWLAAKKA